MSTTKRIAALLATLLMTFGLLLIPAVERAPVASAQTSVAKECGASVAFVVDLSNSLTTNDLANQKTALKSLIKSLEGAPYTLAIYTFASTAPAYGYNNRNYPPTSLMVRGAADKMIDYVNAISLPGGDQGGTNWEGGLQQVALDMSTQKYSTVYFITDGVPTYDNYGANKAGNSTETSELIRAIDQRKRIETYGGKVIPVGVGLDIKENNSRSIYEWNGWWWVARNQATPKEMLNQIASSGTAPIIVDRFDQLPGQLASNFVTGCLFVNKQIVDANGEVLKNGEGWNFRVTPNAGSARSLKTDANGSALTSFDGSVKSVSIEETAQQGFDFKKATCQAYQPGGAPQTVPTTTITQGVRVDLDPAKITSCTFSNLPSVPVYVGKQVQLTSPLAEDKFANSTFDFSYECKIPNKPTVSGDVKGLKSGEHRKIADLPLDATCKVKETNRTANPQVYEVATTWDAENTTDTKTSADGLTYEFKPDSNAYLKNGQVSATAVNSYEPKTAKVTVSKKVTGDAPASLQSKQYPVRYSCRYVPAMSDRPDEGASTNPPTIPDGTVLVPNGGNAEIGPFPMGTQCALSEEATQNNPVLIDGFNLETSWSSDVCDKAASPGKVSKCSTNFIWLDPSKPSNDNYQVAVENKYTQQLGNLKITKQLAGAAKDRGAGKSFLFGVTCERAGKNVFSQSDISVAGGQSAMVKDVPVGSSCTVSEKESSLPQVNIVKARDVTVVVNGEKQEVAEAVMTNELTYKTGPISLNKLVDATGVIDPLRRVEVETASFPVTVTCKKPDSDSPQVIKTSIRNGQSTSLGQFPLGTQCMVAEDYKAPEDLVFYSQFLPYEIKLEEETGASATVKNIFSTPTGDLVVSKNVGVLDSGLADVRSLVPKQFDFALSCSDGTNKLFSIGDSEVKTLSGIAVGSRCTLSEIVTDRVELERHTTIEDQEGTSYSFVMPEASQGAKVQVNNSYTPVFETMSVEKQATLKYADRSAVSEEIREALLGKQDFHFNYTCFRGGNQVVSSGFTLQAGKTKEISVPVNSTCKVTESPTEIAGTSGPDISGAPSLADGAMTLDLATGAKRGTFTNAYTIETGALNLKKKVDGDGVTTISRERMFDFHYRCEFSGIAVREGDFKIGRFDNGKDFSLDKLPIGTSCSVTENPDTAKEENADWKIRWAMSDGPEGYEAEAPCANLQNCEPNANSARVTISENKERNNHQGTLIAWNTFTYDRVNLKVAKKLLRDGPDIASKDDFQVNVTCTPPQKVNLPFELPEQIQRWSATISGAGEVTSEQPFVAGWNCTITELPGNKYDADVSASFEGATLDGESGAFADNPDGVSARFTVQSGNGSTQLITIGNDYKRARAELRLSKKLVGEQVGNVNQYLARKDFQVSYECNDPIADKTYSDTQSVPADGEPVTISGLPAVSTCKFAEDDGANIPVGFADVVNSHHSVMVISGDETIRDVSGFKEIQDISLSADKRTTVAFSNSYFVNNQYFSIEKQIEGDPEHKAFPEGTEFGFTYECDVKNLLPGQPAAAEPKGAFKLKQGDAKTFGPFPVGSSCQVKEDPLTEEQARKLADLNLKMQPNYVHLVETGEPADQSENSTLEQRLGDAPRFPLTSDNTVPLDEKSSHAIVLNSLYRTDGLIAVKKVNPNGEPLEGARFAIYPVDTDGNPGAEPVAADLPFLPDDPSKFQVALKPGSYFLVETRSGTGAELLPKPWQFNVIATNADALLGDLKIKLTAKVENSGLVSIEAPAEGTSDPWVIAVANVEAGNLPKTGGEWMPRWYMFAGVLLLLACGAYIQSTMQKRS